MPESKPEREAQSTRPLPPGSFGHPVSGEKAAFEKDPFGFLWERYRRYGRIFKTYLGGPCVFMIGPEANKFILHDRKDCFSVGKAWPAYLRFMVGDEALAMQDGPAYVRLRTMIAPAFTQETLGNSFTAMKDCVESYLRRWAQAGPIAFNPEARDLLHEVIARWLITPPESSEQKNRLTTLWNRFVDIPQSRGDLPRLATKPSANLQDKLEEQSTKRGVRFLLQRYLAEMIAERRTQPAQDMLSHLCHAQDKAGQLLTESEIISQMLMLLSAGGESTAAAATWFLYDVGQHPEVLDRLRAEIDSVIGDEVFSWWHLKQLSYLACVLKEIERMHPPALAPARVVVKEFEFDGYRVPVGWTARYCILLTHYLPEVFSNPDRFDPDRFAPPREEDKQTPFSLVGFGAGSRHCTGDSFAKLFMHVMAVTVLRHYDWSILPDQDFSMVLDNRTVLKPRDRLNVEFILRNANTGK